MSEFLSRVEEECRAALDAPPMRAISSRLLSVQEPESTLTSVTWSKESLAPALALLSRVTADESDAGRWLLLRGALASLPRIPSWPVAEEVKQLWAEEALFLARPAQALLPVFAPSHMRFQEFAKIVTLRRCPAGQFHWEISGFPRSTILKTPRSDWPGLASTLLRMRGFKPLAEPHLNWRRKNRLTLSPSENIRSLYLIARSIELQPEIRGICEFSWYLCESTAKVSPRIAWMREFFVENGAFVSSAGPAPADSGFLTGSEERRALYEQGRYHPTIGYALWPRRAVLRWADGQALDFKPRSPLSQP